MTPLILCWLTVPTATPLALIRAASAGGFASVGMRIVEAGEPDIAFVGGSGEKAAEVRRAADGEGVSILRTAGFRMDGRYNADRFYPFIEATAELGATYVSVIATDSDPTRRVADFADLCSRAAEFGLRGAVEFTPFSAVKAIEDGLDFVVKSGHDDAAILLDTLHLYRSGGKAEDIRAVPSQRLAVAQLCDGKLAAPEASQLLNEARNDRLDLGKGEWPLVDFMRALPPGIPLEVEVPCWEERDLPPMTRAINAGRATRAYLAQFDLPAGDRSASQA